MAVHPGAGLSGGRQWKLWPSATACRHSGGPAGGAMCGVRRKFQHDALLEGACWMVTALLGRERNPQRCAWTGRVTSGPMGSGLWIVDVERRR